MGVARRTAEQELDIGRRQVGAGFDKTVQTARQHGCGARPEQMGADDRERHPVEPHGLAERPRLRPGCRRLNGQVILKVPADIGGLDHRLDPHAAQMVAGADPRQHQQLRGIEDTAGQNDFLGRANDFRLAEPRIGHAGRPVALHHDAGDMGAVLQGHVAAPQRRAQERRGGTVAAPLMDGRLAAAQPFLFLAVVILGEAEPHGIPRFDPRVPERIVGFRALRMQRSLAAAPVILAFFPAFHAPEIGQHIGIGPARRPIRGPAVVVPPMAPHIGHHVDRRRAADDLAPHRFDLAAVEVCLGLGIVSPVMRTLFMHLAEPERNMNQRVRIGTAGLQDQYAVSRVRAEAVGQQTPGAARAHNHVIVFFCPGHAVSFSLRLCGVSAPLPEGRILRGRGAIE